MPNRSRSLRKEQLRTAKRFILDTSFHDRIQAESVCILTPSQIKDLLHSEYECVHVYESDFTKGEVIVDSRGNGSFQK